jgi:hypothetical protein
LEEEAGASELDTSTRVFWSLEGEHTLSGAIFLCGQFNALEPLAVEARFFVDFAKLASRPSYVK